MPAQTILLLIAIGIAAGMLSGFVGVGGGILVVPALVFLMGMAQHEAQGTSLLLLMIPVGIFAVYNYYRSGNINIQYSLTIAVGFVAGAYLGSRLALKMSPELVKRVFGVFMLLVALKMIFSK